MERLKDKISSMIEKDQEQYNYERNHNYELGTQFYLGKLKALKEILQMIEVIWAVDDVLQAAEDEGITITEDEAMEILHNINNHHDATEGINWDVLYYAINELDREKKRDHRPA